MPTRDRKQNLALMAAVCGVLSVPSVTYAAEKLGSYEIDNTAISVSGISSGAYMAQQFHVAHSKEIMGAGIVAGGPYDCAGSKPGWPGMFTAMDVCSHTIGTFVPFMGPPDAAKSVDVTKAAAKKKSIDPIVELKEDKVFLFSGTKDDLVPQSVMQKLQVYYQAFVDTDKIVYENSIPANHAMITDDYGNACDAFGDPYINNCHYDLAAKILEHIYTGLKPPGDPATGKMIEFDQTEFFPPGGNISLNQVGHLFVPPDCETGGGCRLHIAFHGCKQNQEEIGDAYYQHAGYNKWAATNRIVVLYPQTAASTVDPQNPNACWDWWGYTDNNFYLKSGKQVMVVQKMISRLSGQ